MLKRLVHFGFKSAMLAMLAACALLAGSWVCSNWEDEDFMPAEGYDSYADFHPHVTASRGIMYFTPNARTNRVRPCSTMTPIGPAGRWSWMTVPHDPYDLGQRTGPWSIKAFDFVINPLVPRGWEVMAPIWSVILLLAFPPLVWVGLKIRAIRRARRRIRRGLCQCCGYDLRGGHERCPECGTPTASRTTLAVALRLRTSASVIVMLVVIGATPPVLEMLDRLKAAPYEKVVDRLGWDPNDGNASLTGSIANFGGDYTIDCSPQDDAHATNHVLNINVRRGGRPLYAWSGHLTTSFVRKGRALIYADYSQNDAGCTLVAVDLDAGKVLWITEVTGSPRTTGSVGNWNSVRVRLSDNAVFVWGEEVNARYVSVVDIASGKVMAHKTFDRR